MGDQYNDEFDVYFARAASFITDSAPLPTSVSTYSTDQCCLIPLTDVVDYGRHDSLPDIEISLLLDDVEDGVQPRSPARTSSCRYPHRRRKGSTSPSCSSYSSHASPVNTDQSKGASAKGIAAKDVGMRCSPSVSFCLRAPSPRHELRCHSAPHSRSSSWKKIKRPLSSRDLKDIQNLDDDERDTFSRRGTGVSLEEAISAKLQELKLLQADDCYVVRQFSTASNGGIINRGDSIKRRASSTSTNSGASRSPSTLALCPSQIVGSISAPEMPSATAAASVSLPFARRLSDQPDPPEPDDKESAGKFHLLVLGDEGVGKTSLLQQFMTSEYMAAVQTSFDDECDKTLSVLLDGEETMLEFMETNSSKAIQDWQRHRSIVDAFIFVYSLTARDSFKFVVDQLHQLRDNQSEDAATTKPVVIVANKTDLVRTRQVSEEEGREISRVMDTTYWEVSTALNHQLDELLVGIVTSLRRSRESSVANAVNHNEAEIQRRGSDSDEGGAKERGCVRSATEMIRNLFRRQQDVSKSCEYLL